MNFEMYYDKFATDRDVLREVRKGLRPEVKDRSHRQVRHDLYRTILCNRAQMAKLLNWYPTV